MMSQKCHQDFKTTIKGDRYFLHKENNLSYRMLITQKYHLSTSIWR